MNRKLEVIIIEDDVRACKDLEIAISDRNDEFLLLDSTADAPKGIEIVLKYKPDVVILDLELHKGQGSGLTFLEDLQKQAVDNFPFVLVTTNNISKVVHDVARKLGADLIITKNEPDYSAKTVLDSLTLLKPAITKKRTPYLSVEQTKASVHMQTERVKERITNDLLTIGISPKDVGFKYLVEGVMMSRKGYVINLTNEIAKLFCKTEPSVERAMQNAINRAWNTNDIEVLMQNYTARIRSDRAVPTIMEFISYYASKHN